MYFCFKLLISSCYAEIFTKFRHTNFAGICLPCRHFKNSLSAFRICGNLIPTHTHTYTRARLHKHLSALDKCSQINKCIHIYKVYFSYFWCACGVCMCLQDYACWCRKHIDFVEYIWNDSSLWIFGVTHAYTLHSI